MSNPNYWRKARQQTYNQCNLFGQNNLANKLQYQLSPKLSRDPSQKIKCPKSKQARKNKNLNTIQGTASPKIIKLSIPQSPPVTYHRVNQANRCDQNIFPSNFNQPYRNTTARALHSNAQARIIYSPFITIHRSPNICSPRHLEVPIQNFMNQSSSLSKSKATTINTQRSVKTLKQYKSLKQFQPKNTRSLINSTVDEILQVQQSLIEIDFFKTGDQNRNQSQILYTSKNIIQQLH